MKSSILLIFLTLVIFQIGKAQVTKIEKEKIENFKFSSETDYNVLIKIDRLTSERQLDHIMKSLPILGVIADIEHTRNEFGEITYLLFQSVEMSCSSDEFGALRIVIKNNNLLSCSATDLSHILK